MALQRGDEQTARAPHQSEAIATKPTLRLGHFNLALLAERQGDVRRAERGYLEELKAHPESYKAAVQHVAALRAGRRSRRADWRAEAVDREQPLLRRRTPLPGQGVLDSNQNLDEAVELARKALDVETGSGGRAARPLCDRRHLQPARGRPADSQREAALGRALGESQRD